MPLSDHDVFERFARRFAGIEPEVPRTPPFTTRQRRVGLTPRRSVAGVGAALLVVIVAIPLLGLASYLPFGHPSVSAPSVPPEVSSRSALPSCGSERATTQTGPWNTAARTCFWNAYEKGQPAEFVTTSLTIEGDPITQIYRVLGPARVEIFVDSTQDKFGSGGWSRLECTSLASSGTSEPPQPNFGPGASCSETAIAVSSVPPATLPPSSPPNQHPDAAFPTEVAGLPVVTVARAADLLQAGTLDGQAVTVAGYFSAFSPSCPYPGRYIGPLEKWCSFTAFTDTRAGAQLCEPYGSNGTSCHQPTGTNLSPFLVTETSGNASAYLGGAGSGGPAALVLVGHAGDARQWLCTTATQDACAHAFVVDRVAWADGHDVPLAAAQTGNRQSGAPISPKMTLQQVIAAVGLGDNVVAAAPLLAGDVATVDPRWNTAGDNLVWIARSIDQSGPSTDGARPETVWLIDDATRAVIDSHPLKLDASYQPARLWQMATVLGYECCGGNLEAFASVRKADGNLVYQGLVSGSASGGQGYTTFGGGYGSPPLVLPAGNYTITHWLADYANGVIGTPRGQCSTELTLRPLENVTVNSNFPATGACTFGPAPSLGP